MVQCLLNCLEISQTIISNSMGVMWLQDIPDYSLTSGRMQPAYIYKYVYIYIYIYLIWKYLFFFKAIIPFSISFSSYNLSHRYPGHFAYRVSHSLNFVNYIFMMWFNIFLYLCIYSILAAGFRDFMRVSSIPLVKL